MTAVYSVSVHVPVLLLRPGARTRSHGPHGPYPVNRLNTSPKIHFRKIVQSTRTDGVSPFTRVGLHQTTHICVRTPIMLNASVNRWEIISTNYIWIVIISFTIGLDICIIYLLGSTAVHSDSPKMQMHTVFSPPPLHSPSPPPTRQCSHTKGFW